MNIFLHDYGGYAFPVQLSRALTERGHRVRHVYCASIPTTPKGAVEPQPSDAPGLSLEGIALSEPLNKFSYFKRWRQEREYARLLARAASQEPADVILSGNAPLDAQGRLLRHAESTGTPFVFWLQDILGVAAERVLRRKIPVAGAVIGKALVRQERRQLAASDAVVGITDDFRPLLARWGVEAARIHTIENWAPLASTPVRPKDNAWSRAQGLAESFVFLYSGNLGLKHDPMHLVRLTEHFRGHADVRVAVITQGWGREFLEREKIARGLDGLILLDFQPYEALPDVLGASDVLVALLEPDAGVYSVPSKVLTYLCAARPLLLAVPPENLAARIVAREDAGRLAAPSEAGAFLAHAEALHHDADLRARLGRNARAYAETHFAIDAIAERFEAVLGGVLR